MGNAEKGYLAAWRTQKAERAAKSLRRPLSGETKRLEVHLTIEDNAKRRVESGELHDILAVSVLKCASTSPHDAYPGRGILPP
jgi:hypothetical protein